MRLDTLAFLDEKIIIKKLGLTVSYLIMQRKWPKIYLLIRSHSERITWVLSTDLLDVSFYSIFVPIFLAAKTKVRQKIEIVIFWAYNAHFMWTKIRFHLSYWLVVSVSKHTFCTFKDIILRKKYTLIKWCSALVSWCCLSHLYITHAFSVSGVHWLIEINICVSKTRRAKTMNIKNDCRRQFNNQLRWSP